jgi:peptidoglycan/LPS O-acetylase OafA/YrhL
VKNLSLWSASIQSKNDIRSLTGLRGIAAIYVVFYHYFPLTAAVLTNPAKRVLDHGCLAVDLFFVLSGFVMAMNYAPLFAARLTLAAYRTFLGRRIARIYPLYLAATFAGSIAIGVGWLAYTPSVPLGTAAAANVLLVQAWGIAPSFDSPAWSISAEWAAYLIFPLLLVPTMLRRPTWAWVSAGASAAVLAALCLISNALIGDHRHDYLIRTPLNHNGYWLALPVARCIAEFTLGLIAFRLATTAFGRRLATSAWMCPALCLLALCLLASPHSDLAIVLLLPFLVIGLSGEQHVIGRLLASPPLVLLGTLSYSIYLSHKLLLGLLVWLTARAAAHGTHHPTAVAAAACMALTVTISALAYRLIEAPGRAWIRRLLAGGGIRRPTPETRRSASLGDSAAQ